MTNKVIKFSIFLLLMVLLAGCGGVPQTYYYRVDYDLPTDPASNSQIPITLGVEKFSADILYEGDRIVYRNSPYEVQYYHYRRWIAPPRKIVDERVLAQLQSSSAFQSVVKYPCQCQPDFLLSGKIKAFEEWDEETAWYGIVTLAFELKNAKTQAVVWKKEISEKTQAGEKSPVEVVEAISKSLQKVVDQAITDMEQQVKS